MKTIRSSTGAWGQGREKCVVTHSVSIQTITENDDRPQVQLYMGIWYLLLKSKITLWPIKYLCLDQQRYLCRVVTVDIRAGIFLVTRLVAELDFLLNRCFVSVGGLTLSSCQVPTQVLLLSSSTGQGGKRRWKCSSVEIMYQLPSRQNRLNLRKIKLIYC